MYRTVIVEDDPVITLLNRRYIEKDERFCVVQTFSAAHPALFWLRSQSGGSHHFRCLYAADEWFGAAAHAAGQRA